MAKRKDDRGRVWAFELYPDSAPENWREIISGWHVPVVVSPLHEFDLNPDGTTKKAHWHALLQFDGNKSEDQVKSLIEPLHGPKPIRVESIRGMVRYFVHADNPEKHQYNKADILEFGGFESTRFFEFAQGQRLVMLREMRDFIRDNEMSEYSDFVTYCDHNRHDWQELLDTNSAMTIRYFMQNLHFKMLGDDRS